MKELKRKALIVVGILALIIFFYSYFTTEGSDLKYLIGIFSSLYLIYYSIKTKTTDTTENIKS